MKILILICLASVVGFALCGLIVNDLSDTTRQQQQQVAESSLGHRVKNGPRGDNGSLQREYHHDVNYSYGPGGVTANLRAAKTPGYGKSRAFYNDLRIESDVSSHQVVKQETFNFGDKFDSQQNVIVTSSSITSAGSSTSASRGGSNVSSSSIIISNYDLNSDTSSFKLNI